MALPRKDNYFDLTPVRFGFLANQFEKINTSEVERFLESLDEKRFASNQLKKKHVFPYIQPRAGTGLIDLEKKIVEALAQSDADFIPLTIDSSTRLLDYETVKVLIEKSIEAGKSFLNGYPLVNYGYSKTREILKDVDKPISLRHGTADARLLVEMALASGITEIEGGAICYNVPYNKDYPISKSLLAWQYVDRICASYSTPQKYIHRESFGPLTGTMVPPAIQISIQLVEFLLACEQGVKSFALSFGQTGSFEQDIATGTILKKLTNDYKRHFGFNDVETFFVFHQWMGAFPSEQEKALALIIYSTIISVLIKFDKLVIKTVAEAKGIPTIEDNLLSISAVKYLMGIVRLMKPISSDYILEEEDLIEKEVLSLMDFIFNSKDSCFMISVLHAIEAGSLDVPYAPHCKVANRLKVMRADNGSIRIIDKASMPIGFSEIAKERKLIDEKYLASDYSYYNKLVSDIDLMVR